MTYADAQGEIEQNQVTREALASAIHHIDEFRSKAFTRWLIANRQTEILEQAFVKSGLPADLDNLNKAHGRAAGYGQFLEEFNRVFSFEGKVPVDEDMLIEFEKENRE